MKKIKKLSIHLIDDNTGDEGILSVIREFDENGKLLLDARYYDGINIEQKILRKYDTSGRLLEESSYSDSDEPDMQLVFEYDDQGRLYQSVTHYMAGNSSIATHQYDAVAGSETVHIVDDEGNPEEQHYIRKDAENRVLEETISDPDGQIIQKIVRAYDETGRLLSVTTAHEGNKPVNLLYHYETNDAGQVVYIRLENEKGDILREEEYEYNELGERTEWRYEDHIKGTAGIERWEFDTENRMTKHQVLTPSETPLEEEILVYNEHGDVVEREYISPNGVNIQTYHYEYF